MHLSNKAWATLLCLALLIIYLPGLGHGFIKDDFEWIAESRVASVGDLADLLTHARGFYRPTVSLSFALNHWLFGLDPLGYGLTNLALVLGIGLALWSLARTLGMSSGAGLLAAAFWTLNFHGIRMSVLWISGRTALLVTLFSVLAAQAFASKRTVATVGWCLLAMLSKEEATLLPFVLLAWSVLLTWEADRRPGIEALGRGVPLLIPLAVYAVLRVQTDAMTPGSAPAVYQFSFEPSLVVKNALEYFDRAATLPTASALVLSLVAWSWPSLRWRHLRRVALGVVWMVGGYALTLFLPIRSSLYACLPSVGAALAGAAYLEAVWEEARPQVRQRLLAVGVVAALAAIPAHWARNQSWIRPADVSTLVMDHLVEVVDTLPPDGGVLISEDLSAPTRMEHAFGTLIQTAAELYVGRHVPVWIDPPPRDSSMDMRTVVDIDRIALRLAVQGNRVVQVDQ